MLAACVSAAARYLRFGQSGRRFVSRRVFCVSCTSWLLLHSRLVVLACPLLLSLSLSLLLLLLSLLLPVQPLLLLAQPVPRAPAPLRVPLPPSRHPVHTDRENFQRAVR